MKKNIILFIFVLFCNLSFAQEFGINYGYTNNSGTIYGVNAKFDLAFLEINPEIFYIYTKYEKDSFNQIGYNRKDLNLNANIKLPAKLGFFRPYIGTGLAFNLVNDSFDNNFKDTYFKPGFNGMAGLGFNIFQIDLFFELRLNTSFDFNYWQYLSFIGLNYKF